MIQNVLFDWSGTLVDDLPAVLSATNHVLKQAGLEEFTLERFRAEFCLPFKSFYDRVTPHIPLPQLEEWFHAHFKQAQDSVVELPHARQFLNVCRKRQIRMFVLSTVHPDHFGLQASVTGFKEYFEVPYSGVLDKQAKIRPLLEENQLRPEETLFVGDMRHDIDTAHHGGVHSCAVLTGYTPREQLELSEPDLIVAHLGELECLLEKNGWRLASS